MMQRMAMIEDASIITSSDDKGKITNCKAFQSIVAACKGIIDFFEAPISAN